MTVPVVYTSLGSLIIDDIVYEDGSEEKDILGGAGIYAIYGMRVWKTTGRDSRTIGYIAKEGFDHPETITRQLDSLDMTIRHDGHKDQHTTRGLNTFGPNDHRDFEYIHPIIRITARDPPEEWVRTLRVIHIICSPERAIEIVTEWRDREQQCGARSGAVFIWEPVPWSCRAECLDLVRQASQLVDVLTPNHEEAQALLGHKLDDSHGDHYMQQLFHATQPRQALIVRAGRRGAAVMTKDMALRWVPAYHDNQDLVRDVTGAGNAFCGGLCIGWSETNGDPVMAAMFGAVSSSFAVEQVGLPMIHQKDTEDQWNDGPSARIRLRYLQDKMAER
ncbi:Ribokinase-like protein [Syncephalastrum racemosum]|uniref:Ribokinase-like protein n=1 Tax=Syncephalastrum racemosum TaxID=13706 RepID=A0A1X2HM96_SYNRA|nr:Ribokinase-like protein [Syncephalastrum racemosum]